MWLRQFSRGASQLHAAQKIINFHWELSELRSKVWRGIFQEKHKFNLNFQQKPVSCLGSERADSVVRNTHFSKFLQKIRLHTFRRNSKSSQWKLIIFCAAWSWDAPLENWRNHMKWLKFCFVTHGAAFHVSEIVFGNRISDTSASKLSWKSSILDTCMTKLRFFHF